MTITAPTRIPEPFANQASAGYINQIPDTTVVQGAASWRGGFPDITMLPESAGGIAPAGQDVNGILFALSSHLYFLQGGQLYTYDAGTETAIGGYAVGTILAAADGSGFWYRYDATTTPSNPDTGGPGWCSMYTYGSATVTAQSTNIVLTAQQAAAPVLIITGTPVNNLSVVYPTGMQFAQRLIVNQTSGGFTITVITSGGNGVPISQGGSGNPTGIWSDGTNVYALFQPAAALNISVNPSANSLVQRNANGYIFATYLNQASGLENPVIGAIFVQSAAQDGYLRKITPQNFIGQLGIAPLANPQFRGTPTAPTPNNGDNSGRIATTAFVQSALSSVQPKSQAAAGVGQVWSGTSAESGGSATIYLPSGGVWEWWGIVANINGSNAMQLSGSYAINGISAGGTPLTYIASDGGATRIFIWAKRIS